MYSVILVNLPSTSVRRPEEHCGLAYLHSILTYNRISTKIIDAYAQKYDIKKCYEEIEKVLYNDNDYIVGFSPYVTTYDSMVTIANKLKANYPRVKIVAGGHFATLNSKFLINEHDWLDGIIIGEGEYTLVEYAINPNKDSINGFLRKDKQFCPRGRVENLDNLPFQTRYLSKEQLNGQPFSLVTSRGCNGACTFCSISTFYKNNTGYIYKSRSAKSVVDEIELLINNYGINSFKIVDDNFCRPNDVDNTFLKTFVSLLKDRNLRTIFRVSLRPDNITEQVCELLKQAGTEVVAIGGESASLESLKLFNKRITPVDTKNAINLLDKYQIKCLLNFINFDPIVSVNGLRENYNFILEHKGNCVLHRINSHLWLRETDPITKILREMGLAGKPKFPYVDYYYKDDEVRQIKESFDKWCNSNMTEYYEVVDYLMAPGEMIANNIWNKYQKILSEDLNVLDRLIKQFENI